MEYTCEGCRDRSDWAIKVNVYTLPPGNKNKIIAKKELTRHIFL